MTITRLTFKSDDFGNPIYADITWSIDTQAQRPKSRLIGGSNTCNNGMSSS